MNRFLRPKTYLFYLQRKVKSYSMREKISFLLSKYIGKTTITAKSFLGLEYKDEFVEQLKNNGFVEFPIKLSENIISNIINSVKSFELIDNFNPHIGRFTFENISAETHVADYDREDIIQTPHILDIANDSVILKIVQNFLGAKPTISNINMWWSFAGRQRAKDAQLFHRDVDDIKFCKLFIYLTDVGPNDGPHTYVKGSSSQNKLTKIRRYQDKEITSVFGEENVTQFIRPKGSMFLVDTYGFHKGTLPIDNDRLLLQMQYSLLPILIETYKPQKHEKSNAYNTYINRLMIKS